VRSVLIAATIPTADGPTRSGPDRVPPEYRLQDFVERRARLEARGDLGTSYATTHANVGWRGPLGALLQSAKPIEEVAVRSSICCVAKCLLDNECNSFDLELAEFAFA